MGGLIDDTVGLDFGAGLQCQPWIGTATLTFTATPDIAMVSETGTAMVDESGTQMVTES